MSYRAIYTYAWDLAEEGVEEAVGQFLGLGLNTVTMAGSYHAGKFLRPHGRNGRVYFPQDGTIYFKHSESKYGRIKPIPNALLKDHDVLGQLLASKHIATNLWLVLLHNTPLGLQYTDCCVANAFGDRYIYSLCPSSPDARRYARDLVFDLAGNLGVNQFSLESPGFAPYVHGYHHEFALQRPNRWLDNMLGLCFCDHCVGHAENEGLEAKALKQRVADDISAYLASDVDFPADMAEAFWLADTRCDGVLGAYLAFRSRVVTSLISEIREGVSKETTVAVIPSVARPTGGAWYEGSDLAALAEGGNTIEACFYEPSAARVKADVFDIKRRMRGKGKLRGILRPAYPDFESKAEFLAAIRILKENGVTDLAFYNWGHIRAANLAWIGDAMQMLGDG